MIYSYQKSIDDIRTVEMALPMDAGLNRIGTELATIDGTTYVFVPDTTTLPPQPPEITVAPVTLTDALRDSIKAHSPQVWLINERVKEKIRERYDSEDEQYLTRISVGKLMGIYTYLPGEEQQVLDYGAHVESVRTWARDQRAAIGL